MSPNEPYESRSASSTSLAPSSPRTGLGGRWTPCRDIGTRRGRQCEVSRDACCTILASARHRLAVDVSLTQIGPGGQQWWTGPDLRARPSWREERLLQTYSPLNIKFARRLIIKAKETRHATLDGVTIPRGSNPIRPEADWSARSGSLRGCGQRDQATDDR